MTRHPDSKEKVSDTIVDNLAQKIRRMYAAGLFKGDQPRPMPNFRLIRTNWVYIVKDQGVNEHGAAMIMRGWNMLQALRSLKDQGCDFALASNYKPKG